MVGLGLLGGMHLSWKSFRRAQARDNETEPPIKGREYTGLKRH